MSNLAKLLDNQWVVLLSRQVDMQYVAAARRAFGETWKDVFELVNVDGQPAGFPTDDFERARFKGHRMEHRIATGSTPEEATERLVNQVLGLEPA